MNEEILKKLFNELSRPVENQPVQGSDHTNQLDQPSAGALGLTAIAFELRRELETADQKDKKRQDYKEPAPAVGQDPQAHGQALTLDELRQERDNHQRSLEILGSDPRETTAQQIAELCQRLQEMEEKIRHLEKIESRKRETEDDRKSERTSEDQQTDPEKRLADRLEKLWESERTYDAWNRSRAGRDEPSPGRSR